MAITLKTTHKKIAIQLAVLATVCLFLIFLLDTLTKERVIRNKQAFLSASLSKVLPENLSLTSFDNDVLASKKTIDDVVVYPACKNGILEYALIEITTNKGYSGTIKLLVNIGIKQHEIISLRPLFHQETPGLGDNIDIEKSDWLQQFILPLDSTKVITINKDGGDIDSLTGATITSRAVANIINEKIFALNLQTIVNLCSND